MVEAGCFYYENAALSGFAVILMIRGELHFPLMAVWITQERPSGRCSQSLQQLFPYLLGR